MANQGPNDAARSDSTNDKARRTQDRGGWKIDDGNGSGSVSDSWMAKQPCRASDVSPSGSISANDLRTGTPVEGAVNGAIGGSFRCEHDGPSQGCRGSSGCGLVVSGVSVAM